MSDTVTCTNQNEADGESFGTSRKLNELSVIVETAVEDQLELLMQELKKLRTKARLVSTRASRIPADADVVFCDYSPDLEQRLPWAIGEATAALVIMLPQNDPFSPALLEAATPDAILARPFTTNAIKASLIMGLSQFRYERRLRGKAAKLEENLRAMRAIERAKAIVMNTRSISGEEAYQYIRSQAMTRRLSVSAIAEAIISSYDLLGGLPRT